MGKSKSSAAPQPFQPTAPQSSFGNTMNYAPMSGYTRAGEGIAGVDMNAIQQRIMADRQRMMQMQMQQAPDPNAEPAYFYGSDGMSRTKNPYYKGPAPQVQRRPLPRNALQIAAQNNRNGGWTSYGNREYRNTGPGSDGWKIQRGKSPGEDGRDK